MSNFFYFSKARQVLIAKPGTTEDFTAVPSFNFPALTSLPVSIQFLAGEFLTGYVVQNPATGTLVEMAIKRSVSDLDTDRLAYFSTTSAVTGDYFVGSLNTNTDRVKAALDAAYPAKGISFDAVLLLAYTLSGGPRVACRPVPCTLVATGWNSGDTNPTAL